MVKLKRYAIATFLLVFILSTISAFSVYGNELTGRDILIRITEKLNDKSYLLDDMDTDYQFNLDQSKYQIFIHDNQAKFTDGTPKDSDCIIITSEEDFKKLVTGELDPYDAYFSGRLKVDGDLGKAIKLVETLQQLRD